jgi:hypothetical protein
MSKDDVMSEDERPKCQEAACVARRYLAKKNAERLEIARTALEVIAKSWPIGHDCAAQEHARAALLKLGKGNG